MKQKIMALLLASVMMLQGVTAGAAEISLADVSESEMPGISGMQPSEKEEVQPELIELETEALSGAGRHSRRKRTGRTGGKGAG